MAKPAFTFVEWECDRWTLRGAALAAQEKGGPWCIVSHGFTGHHLGPGYLFVRMSRDLAEAGISSLRFDYGGCGESDGLFREMTIETMKADLLSATNLVRTRFAPSTIIYIGHSLGGMIAALCAADAVPDGVVLLSPIAEPEGLIRRRREMIDTGPNRNGYYENGPHEMSPRFLDGLRGIDPAALFAKRFKGELLLIQGDADASIPVSESGRFVDAARAAGIETASHILAGADHSYSTVAHFTAVCFTVTSWVKDRFV